MDMDMDMEEKIKNMKIAAGIVGYNFKHEDLDMLVSLYDLVSRYKGKTDVDMIIDTQQKVEKRKSIKKRSELLDKVSVNL